MFVTLICKADISVRNYLTERCGKKFAIKIFVIKLDHRVNYRNSFAVYKQAVNYYSYIQ